MVQRAEASSIEVREVDEGGFTLLEMTIAMSLVAITLMTLALGMFGGMRVLDSNRRRSAFVEYATSEVERIRALDFALAGVDTSDPDKTTAYPAGKFGGRDMVEITPHNEAVYDTSPPAPLDRRTDFPAVEIVTTAPVTGLPVPFTVRRWITWTDASGGTTHQFKRIDIRIDWTEGNGSPRHITFSSVYYPGGLGPTTSTTSASPTAAFTKTPASGPVGTTFSFDAATSTTPGATTITGWAWNFGDSTTSTAGPTTSHSYSSPGSYTVQLVVTNSAGASSAPVTQNVTVGAAGLNQPPVASFTINPSPSTGAAPLTVTVDGSSSSDPNNDPLTYVWIWGDGTPNGSGATSNHTYTNPNQSYTLTLTVTDPNGTSSSATTTVTTAPVAVCTINTGFFKNPGTDPVANDIKVGSNQRPDDNNFTFTATTNLSCTTVTASLPKESGAFSVTFTLLSTAGNTKTWTATGSTNDKFNVGTAQSSTFTARNTSVTPNETSSINPPFCVHKTASC